MTTGEQIFHAIERLSVALSSWEEFKTSLKDAFLNEGTEYTLAEQLVGIIDEHLKANRAGNYHLSLVKLITKQPDSERIVLQDVTVTKTFRQYMSFYVDASIPEPAYAVHH
ncbi:hypothetical protein ACONUD_05145 [Microbulbifer harenosus]|uniref:Uncharacterized protein n=1 Tax=Microbulbifer harenosus TaxID=2576840 RepID=A0ABY2UI40_9GAMM|nr:hypothetical protein [Microbulbifer harenosus]TLM76424.1 hypothetical protein FDY93_13675 [Microbulbifer harenosus]